MTEYLPPENNAVSSLLAVISDPKAAQARLDEINKAQADLNTKVDEARQSELAAEKAKADAAEALKKQQDIKKWNEEVLAQQQDTLNSKIDQYDQALKDHQTRVAQEIKDVNAQRQINAQKELELSQRETSVSSRESAVSVREKETAGIKEAYEKKLDAASRLFAS